MAEHPHWWVTIRLDACRTRDELIQARSQWAAGWLYRQLHPSVEVLGVRPVHRGGIEEAAADPPRWCWDPMPPVDGWFAVIRCWEPEEGMFAGVVHATKGRVEWPDDGGMTSDGSGHAGPFATKAEAQAWADRHDPEGL